MDEQKPYWLTAWYWKQFGLFAIALFVLEGILAVLSVKWHILSRHQLDRILMWATPISSVGFMIWVNHQDKKRTT